MCQTRILSSKDSVVVSQCLHCGVLFIWHNNILLNFTPGKFDAFRNAVGRLKFYECCSAFPDGEERAIISTPNPEISFTFTIEEWQTLKEALDEAVFMQEIYSMMI